MIALALLVLPTLPHRACKVHDTWAECVVAIEGGEVALRGGCDVWGGGVGGDVMASACLSVGAGSSAVADSCAFYGNSLDAAVIAEGGGAKDDRGMDGNTGTQQAKSMDACSALPSLELTGCDVHSSRVGLHARAGAHGKRQAPGMQSRCSSCRRASRLCHRASHASHPKA